MNKEDYYNNPWLYNDDPVTEIPKGKYGFVYCITNLLTGKMYIGRKYFWTKRKPKGAKRKVTKESDWKNYYGSCKELLEDIEMLGKEFFHREVLCFCDTMGQTNYKEVEIQFKRDVLTEVDGLGNRLYYNGNILSRYFAPKDEFDEEHRNRLSESQKLRYIENPKTEEEKEHQRKKMEEWWNSAPPETKERIANRISESTKGRQISEETREKISNTLKGRNLSAETIEKMKGRVPWNKGISGEEWKLKCGDNYCPPPSREGKILITDGIETKVVSSDDDIPDGWYKGTTNKTTSKQIKILYKDGSVRLYHSLKDLREDQNMPLSTANRLMTKYDDPEFNKRRKTFLDIYKIEYVQ